MPRGISGYGVTAVVNDKRVCDILLRLCRVYGGAASHEVRRLPIEDYHPLPQVMNTVTAVTCINESHPPLGEIRQYLTLIVDDPLAVAQEYKKSFDDEGIPSSAGDLREIRPHIPPELLAFVTVADIRVTFFPVYLTEFAGTVPPFEPYLED